MAAALQGHAEMCTKLVEAGADPTAIDENGENSLYMAASSGQVAALEMLLGTEKLDVNATSGEGETPLITCSWFGHVDAVNFLIENVSVEPCEGSFAHRMVNATTIICCRTHHFATRMTMKKL